MVGLGEPRVVRAGVVGGSYFDVMGLRPVLGRLLDANDDGAQAAGAAVLTHRFWTTVLKGDPSVDRQVCEARPALGDDRRRARALGAVPGGNRDHRQRRHQPTSHGRDDDRRPRPSDDRALRPSGAGCGSRSRACGVAHGARGNPAGAPGGVLGEGRFPDRGDEAARSDRGAGAHRAAGAARGVGAGLHHRVLERRQSDPGAIGPARRRTRRSRVARREHGGVAAHAAGGEPRPLRSRRHPRRAHRATDGIDPGALRGALLGARARSERRCQPSVGGRRPGDCRGDSARLRSASSLVRCCERLRPRRTGACGLRRPRTGGCACLP